MVKSSKELQSMLDRIQTLDPDKIDFSNPIISKQIVIILLNALEFILQENQSLKEENQKNKDEIARLKGEKGRPDIKPNVPKKENNVPEQKKSKKWKKESKKAKIRIDKIEIIDVNKEDLPEDAEYKGYKPFTVQDIDFKTRNTEYRLKFYYSKKNGKTYTANLPEGVKSHFGSELKAFIHFLYFKCRVTENKLYALLSDIGISISEGQISDILTKDKTKEFSEEKQEIYEKGMETSEYFHTDDAGARHKGKNFKVHGVCGLFFTVFFIMNSKSRETIEYILNLSKADWRNMIMVSDDATQFRTLTIVQALCWIHEIRHYRKLNPLLDIHRRALKDFLKEVWKLYHDFNDYRENPDPKVKEEIEKRFKALCTSESCYAELDWRKARTIENTDRLLVAIDYPFVPLNNNPMEIGVREPVIKKKISNGTRSEEGRNAWENMLSIQDTCRKLDISFYAYLKDRFSERNEITRLADVISEKTAQCS